MQETTIKSKSDIYAFHNLMKRKQQYQQQQQQKNMHQNADPVNQNAKGQSAPVLNLRLDMKGLNSSKENQQKQTPKNTKASILTTQNFFNSTIQNMRQKRGERISTPEDNNNFKSTSRNLFSPQYVNIKLHDSGKNMQPSFQKHFQFQQHQQTSKTSLAKHLNVEEGKDQDQKIAAPSTATTTAANTLLERALKTEPRQSQRPLTISSSFRAVSPSSGSFLLSASKSPSQKTIQSSDHKFQNYSQLKDKYKDLPFLKTENLAFNENMQRMHHTARETRSPLKQSTALIVNATPRIQQSEQQQQQQQQQQQEQEQEKQQERSYVTRPSYKIDTSSALANHAAINLTLDSNNTQYYSPLNFKHKTELAQYKTFDENQKEKRKSGLTDTFALREGISLSPEAHALSPSAVGELSSMQKKISALLRQSFAVSGNHLQGTSGSRETAVAPTARESFSNATLKTEECNYSNRLAVSTRPMIPDYYQQPNLQKLQQQIRQTDDYKSVQQVNNALQNENSIDNFTFQNVLGLGSYAIVRLAVHPQSGLQVAVKSYEKQKLLDYQKRKNVSREIKILGKLRHVNIIKLYQVIESELQIHLLMEFMPKCTPLSVYVRTQSERRLCENDSRLIFVQLLQAVRYLHRKCVVHRDIKLENLLVDDLKHLKLIDFGFSIAIAPSAHLNIFCGTPSYMAPEIVNKRDYSFGVDIWAIGIVLYKLVTGNFPFRGRDDKELYRRINACAPEYPQYVSTELKSLLGKALKANIAERATAEELLQDEWVRGATKTVGIELSSLTTRD